MTITAQEFEAIKHVKTRINGALSELRACDLQIDGIIKANTPPATRLIMSWPTGDINRRELAPWWIGQGWAEKYPATMGRNDWHTGADLNEANDVGAPVYACADGVLKFSGVLKGWEGHVVVIEHTWPDRRKLWSRYAHITALPTLAVGKKISRGELIGNIADYPPVGWKQDHLHWDFKVKGVSLADKPGDWPGTDIVRLRDEYVDPVALVLENLP